MTTASQTQRTGFLTGYRPSGSALDELYDRDGSIRPHWSYLIQALEELGAEELDNRLNDGRRLLRDNGVTYNVYDDPLRSERSWPLDPLPLLVPSTEWQLIEQGLVQRAELLELILADLYGPRRLVTDGILPPELVYGHGGFLRPCAGVVVSGGRHLPLYAADVARAPSGRFVVVGDRTQSPSGSGYALENRVVMSHMFPSIFRDAHVHRLPVFFRRLRAMLAGLAPRPEEPPHIVLLTPGPSNETYFEHAYLAGHLGCTLAQGDDLTVRDERVWLRTMQGLRPVDVILRRVDGVFCDPLELRSDSLLGVPGLLQAARRGNVSVVNPLGSSAVENPALLAFLPQIARHLIGEDLKLPSVRTWWCGDPAICSDVLGRLDELVIKPVEPHSTRSTIFGATLAEETRAQVAEAIRARPYLYVAQEHVSLSTTPVLVDGKLEPRASVLRTFLAATDDGYAVMPGGLCRVAAVRDGIVVSNQVGGVSKDIWVLASEPERETTLDAADKPLLVLRGELEVPAHVADNVFWVGRYAERADAAARVLRQLLRCWLEPDRAVGDPQLVALVAVAVRVTGALPVTPAAPTDKELLAALYDRQRTGSMRFDLSALRRSARAVRERFSSDTWRVLNALDVDSTDAAELRRAPAEIDRILLLLAAFSGLGAESMHRGQGWRFLEIGRRLERALTTLLILRSVCPPAATGSAVPWEDLLALADVSADYRRRHRAAMLPALLLELFVGDETNPRSVVYQLRRLERLLNGLSPQIVPPQRSAEEELLQTALAEVAPETLQTAALDVQLDARLARVQKNLTAISDQLTRSYFGRPERLQQLVTINR
jgi:uncharacterized circularly permuted ATP-grasp superfamily protein/uncharacterized alpha-E superfamily protein